MRVIRDFQNRSIRLTAERLAHILEHPEMAGMMEAITRVLAIPERVVRSIADPDAHLYSRYFFDTMVGGKYLCVVVKTLAADSFVLTAYLTNTIKKGAILWPKNR